jgi:hypothetical protein
MRIFRLLFSSTLMRSGFRLLTFLLLWATGLSGCTLLHPFRITNPPLPAGYVAKVKAAEKAKKDSQKALKDEEKTRKQEKKKAQDEDATDTPTGSTPSATPTEAAPINTQATSSLPDKSGVKYDKHELLKKPKLKHRRYYKPARKPFRPWHSIRTFFKKLTTKHHGKPAPAPKSAPASPSATPAPAPADTGLTP